MTQHNTANLLRELRAGLQDLYHNRLNGLYLYGSYARGEQDDESDLDVLVVLDRVDHYTAEIEHTSHLTATLALKYGVSISRVFLSARDWSDRQTPFLAGARQEAIPA
jgi:predicted nucleotidyltransferase